HTTNYDGSFDRFTLQFFADLLESKNFLNALVNTIIYSVGSAIIGIVLGTVLAILVERTNTPGKQFALLGSIISLAIPHVLYVVAWLLLMGRNGPINQMLQSISMGALPRLDIYSLQGMILIE